MTGQGAPEPTPTSPEPAAAHLTGSEIRQRAKAGAVALGLRGAAIRILSLAGYLVLARILGPSDFGLLAIGLSVTFVANFIADAGVGAALLRSPTTPDEETLAAVSAFQLAVSGLIALAATGLAILAGGAGIVTAIIVASLLPLALRTPNLILLERQLEYRPLIRAEVAEVAVYNVAAVAAALAGLGVYGVASATIVKTLTGLGVLVWLGPVGLLRPRWRFDRVRTIIGFGIRFQGGQLVSMARDQGINVATGAIAGLATLGLWSIATRVLQVPFLVFESLWRVSYPAMSRLLETGESGADTIKNGIASGSVLIGLLLAVLAGSSPAAIPILIGDEWRGAADALPAACAGLAITGPISVAATGFLLAAGDASTVLRAVTLQTGACFAVAFPLLPTLGVTAIGLGWLAGCIVDALVLSHALRHRLGIQPLRLVAVPTAAAILGGAAGWAVAATGDPSVLVTLLSAATAALTTLGLLMALRREVTVGAFRQAASALKATVRRPSVG